MRTVIENRNLGIDENDIKNETNLDVLNAWLTDLDRQHQVSKLSLEKEKAKLEFGMTIDKKWEVRVKGFQSTLFILKKYVTDQIRVVKREYKNALQKEFQQLLIKELRTEVGEDRFLEIVELVKSRRE